MSDRYDAVVIGSGPNGLAAAVTIARAGRSVLVLEAQPTIGGGARTAELTLPGFKHDVCSAIHPVGAASPFFRTLNLEEHGLRWVHPEVPLAHPLDDGSAVIVHRSVERTAEGLGPDGRAYKRLFGPFARMGLRFVDAILDSYRPPAHPIVLARVGLVAGLRSANGLAKTRFETEAARAAFGGSSAHATMPLETVPTAAFGLALQALAHSIGWPAAEGGSQSISDALGAHLVSLGGVITTDTEVKTMADLPPARAYLFDVAPSSLVRIAGDRLPGRYRRALTRFRNGPGVFKVDWALDGPIPWKAEGCAGAGTVHVGGGLDEIAAGEREIAAGHVPTSPFVLLAQQSAFDPTRAPAGKQTAWAYCHVPRACDVDMTEAIESQIERFAPGFRDLVIGRAAMSPAQVEAHNANNIGGHIGAGVQTLWQTLFRPVPRWNPYATPDKNIYLCSASTPPGPAVHGMCGYYAARSALKRSLR